MAKLFIKYKIVRGVEKCTYRKKGYLLLELVVGFAVASIMLICVWSSFSTAMNLNTKALEKEQSYKVLNALEKEFDRNVKFEDVLPLEGKSEICATSVEVKNLVDVDFIESKLGSLSEFYIDFSKSDGEKISVEIYKEKYKVGVDKVKCIGIR